MGSAWQDQDEDVKLAEREIRSSWEIIIKGFDLVFG